MSISTFVILMLLNRNYDSSEILQYFKVNSVIITTDTFIACVARGKFYDKDRNTKGLTLLLVLAILSLLYGLVTFNSVWVLGSIMCVGCGYTVYATDMAIYQGKDTLAPSLLYSATRVLLAYVILQLKLFKLDTLASSTIFITTFSDIVVGVLFKRVYWRIRFRNVFKVSFSFEWIKQEVKGILDTLKKNNNSILSRVIKIFVTVSLSSIEGAENTSRFILIVQDAGVPFFLARDYNFKSKLNRIADTDGIDMKTEEDKHIYATCMFWYVLVVSSVLYYNYAIEVPTIVFIIMLIIQSVHYLCFMGNLFFWEAVLKNRSYGLKVTYYYMYAHIGRYIAVVLTRSVYAYLIAMLLEVGIHYLYIYYLYKKDSIQKGEDVKVYKLSELIK